MESKGQRSAKIQRRAKARLGNQTMLCWLLPSSSPFLAPTRRPATSDVLSLAALSDALLSLVLVPTIAERMVRARFQILHSAYWS
jgi:hypothetical protein